MLDDDFANIIITNYLSSHEKIIEITNKRTIETIYLSNLKQSNSIIINECSNITVVIPLKINHILITKCDNIKLFYMGCISSLDLINSNNNLIRNFKEAVYFYDIYVSSNNNLYQYKIIDSEELYNNIIYRSLYSSNNNINLYDSRGIFEHRNRILNMFDPNFIEIF